MRKIILILIIAVILVSGLSYFIFFNKPSSSTPQKTNKAQKLREIRIVNVTKNGFEPKKPTIKKGEGVTWVNKSGKVASVNSDPYPKNTDHPIMNLGRFKDGSSVQVLFDVPGTYKYHNNLTPSQKGEIIVR